MSKVDQLWHIFEEEVRRRPDFFQIRGPGVGDRYSREFVEAVSQRAQNVFQADYSEHLVHADSGLRFDYFFPDEHTAVEIALSLRNSASEFERDILKCLIAKKAGSHIDRLEFFTKSPAMVQLNSPAKREMKKCVKEHFGLDIDTREIGPE